MMGGHFMERKITSYLLKWRKDTNRRPLLIYGSKQIGKTYSVLEFGKKQYKNVVYFNTENNEELLKVVKKEKTIDRIILNLQMLSNESILTNDTLIVLDNVNEVDLVNAIKLFGKTPNDYNIAK